MLSIKKPSLSTLYQTLCATFSVIVVISNIISAKMVKMPFFEDFSIPAGLLTYPLTFLMSDLVTEIFGPKKAKLMVYIALAMNLLSFGIIQVSLMLPTTNESEQMIFHAVLGLSGLRIFSSLLAYIVAQIVDIQLYALIRTWTNSRFLWLRNNGSTCASQIVDTVIIDIVYLYWGMGMTLSQVLPIMFVSYTYKAFFSIANTPFFYLSVYVVKKNWKVPEATTSFKNNLGVSYEPNM